MLVAVETDCTIAMDHMQLSAVNEGLGTCWIAAFDNEALRSVLELEDNEKVFAISPLGYPKEGYSTPDPRGRKEMEEIVTYL